jgi:putative hydrolase of the HAD superfamily
VAHKQRFVEETRPAPGGAEAVAAVRAAGLRVAVLSNGTQSGQAAKLARIGIDVDVLVTSELAGAPKPAPVAFSAIESALGIAGERLAMVGDNVVNDIAGALQAGWSVAVHVRGNGETLPPGALAAVDAHAAVLALDLDSPRC